MTIRRLVWTASLILVSALSFDPTLAAEREDAESGTWLDISASAKIARRTDATLTQHLRWDGALESLDLIAPELSVRRRLESWWRVEGGYRYMRERDNDGLMQHRHRTFANTRFRTRTSDALFELRVQWQEEFRHELDDGTARRHHLRTRAKVRLRGTGSVTPFASVEAYHRLDGGDDDTPAGTLTKVRSVVGASWGRGSTEYGLRYILVVPVHEEQDPLRHVLSLSLGFDLPR